MRMFFTILSVVATLLPALQACLTNFEYYDFLNNACLPCHHTCTTCFDLTVCVACNSQYFLGSDNTCSSCPFGCAVCDNSQTCITCQDGLYIDQDGDCLSCPLGVDTCSIALVEDCTEGYFLLGGICAGCLDNCAKCSDFVMCSMCIDGYYVVPAQT